MEEELKINQQTLLSKIDQRKVEFEKAEIERENQELKSWEDYFNSTAKNNSHLTIDKANEIILGLNRFY